MKRMFIGWVCVLWSIHVVCADGAGPFAALKKTTPTPTADIPWQDLSERATDLARQLIDKPTVYASGPPESFSCTPEQYYWLLDNPDRVVTAWRRLGAKCVNITARGAGRFAYTDELGSDITWEAIHQSRDVRIWFAEGKVKPGAALPTVPVKALVVLHHTAAKTSKGVTVMRHHAELVVHTDSKAAAAVTKMMGQSATKLAEQGLGQLEMFFSALSSYVNRHPDQAESLFRPEAKQ